MYVGDDGYYYALVGGRLARYKPLSCLRCGAADVETVRRADRCEVRCPYCGETRYFDALSRCPVCGELLPPSAAACPACGAGFDAGGEHADESYLEPKSRALAKVVNLDHELNQRMRRHLENTAERERETEPHAVLRALAETALRRGVLRGAEAHLEVAGGAVRFRDCGVEFRGGSFYRGGKRISDEEVGRLCWRDELEFVASLYGVYRSHWRRLQLEGRGGRGKALVQQETLRGHRTEERGGASALRLAECLGVDEQVACSVYAKMLALRSYGEKTVECDAARDACEGLALMARYKLAELVAERGPPPVPAPIKAALLLSFYAEQAAMKCEEGDVQCLTRRELLRRAYEVMSQDAEVYGKMVNMYARMDRTAYGLALLIKSRMSV